MSIEAIYRIVNDIFRDLFI